MKKLISTAIFGGLLYVISMGQSNQEQEKITATTPNMPADSMLISKSEILQADSFSVEYGNYYDGKTGVVSAIGKISLYGTPTGGSNQLLTKAVLQFYAGDVKLAVPRIDTLEMNGKTYCQIVINYHESYMGAIISSLISRKNVLQKQYVYCSYREYDNKNRYADLHWFGLIPKIEDNKIVK
ncbi:MAG: hypothetical protein ACOYNC_05040 [Bacteroidales bacterium]